MSDPAAEYQKLKLVWEAAVLHKEGGNPVVLLPDAAFVAAGKEERMDLLLYPSQHSGYVTRLFFQRQIAGRGDNWTQHRVLERNWWAPSWKDVLPTLSWPAMLCAHLRAVA